MEYIAMPRLGEILKERKMTQMELSLLTGIPQGTISKFDKNRQHIDSHLINISKVLNISIEDLFHVYESEKVNLR